MALTQETVIDKMEVLEDGCIQCREIVRVWDGSVLVATSFTRYLVEPDADTSDYTGHKAKLKKVAAAVWDKATKDAYAEKKAARQLPVE